MNGTIKSLNPQRGFGFILGDDNRSVFFHYSALQNAYLEGLRIGQPVRFDDDIDLRSGRSCAVNVYVTL